MWRIIITSLLYVVATESRPLELEGPLWSQNMAAMSPDLFFRNNPDLLSHQRNYNFDAYNPDDSDYDLALPQLSPNKRALTMFSRWTPLSSIGKQRTPIRSNLINPDASISTQTRGRMQGQPLRWG